MPKYSVIVTRHVFLTRLVEIEAESVARAEQLAQEASWDLPDDAFERDQEHEAEVDEELYASSSTSP